MRKVIIKFLFTISIIFSPVLIQALEPDLKVLMYHRFNEFKYPDTNISSAVFEEHIHYLLDQNYRILPLTKLVDFLRNSKEIPNKSVFITIDDAFKSFYDHGFPILKKLKLPFSIFVSTDFVSNHEKSDFMSWEMLRDISESNGLILNHTKNHQSLLNKEVDMIKQNIIENQTLIEKNLGPQPKILSYPFGESNINIEEIVKKLSYEIAFSQHSSNITRNENLFRLPRFALNEEFGNLSRFKLILKSKPLMVKQINFNDTILNADNFILSFKSKIPSKNINCFINNDANLFKEDNEYFNLLKISNLKLGLRYRINCTHINANGEIFWFGKMFKRIN